VIKVIQEIEQASKRIQNYINKTPIMTSRTLNTIIGAEIFFKCENFQRGGAFKCRGAFNSLLQLDSETRNRGVIAHSSGNHAQAVALATKELGIKATIVMPQNAPQIKKNATRGYGATIVECGNNPADRQEMTDLLIEKHQFKLIHPYNYLPTIFGAGTAAYELITDIKGVDLILAPIGGGGLVSGTSIAVKGICPDTEVFGIEPKNASDAFRSFTEGKLYPSINPNTIADGLRTSLGDITFGIIQKYVSRIITVSELQILDAMKFIWERMKLVVEPSGAVPLAGLFKIREDDYQDLKKKRIGLILSGGNIDVTDFFNFLKSQTEIK
jgi:threonine dehydratase